MSEFTVPNGTEYDREIRAVIDERVQAVLKKDLRPLVGRQADDVVTFGVLPPLLSRGATAATETAQAWFDGYASDIGYEVQELVVHASGTVGFCSFVYHVSGTLAAGGEVNMWVRATLGLEKRDGTWIIVHDHESVPFDPETGQALTGLEP